MAVNKKHKKPRRQRIPAYVVEFEYGATEDADDRLLRVYESLSNMPEVRVIPTDAERREKVVKILAEAVYAYLKRKGLLAAQEAHVAENDASEAHWPGSDDSP